MGVDWGPDTLERALLVRSPYAQLLVDGVKTIEVRRQRHNFVDEWVGIIESGTSRQWGRRRLSPLLGVVRLGHVLRVAVPDDLTLALAERACTTPERLLTYAAKGKTSDVLWGWEISDAEPVTPDPKLLPLVEVKPGHQTWVSVTPDSFYAVTSWTADREFGWRRPVTFKTTLDMLRG